MPQYDVIVFGDTCVDLIVTGADVVPQFGQFEKLVEGYTLEMGGSCCIFACQAAKLGLKVGVLGRVGDDAFGRLVVSRLQESGVDTQHITIDPSLKTGLTIHLTQPGDRAMLTHSGSITALTPADVTDSFLASARHLHYGSLFLHTGLLPEWTTILRRAKNLGLSISLDPNWDPTEQWDSQLSEAWPMVDVFMPNDREAELISRETNLDSAIEHLRGLVKVVALKRGAEGASAYTHESEVHCSVEPAAPGGDGIGAGDSFDAGFLAGWLRGLPLQECLNIACQCGRAVAGKIGGVAGQPRRADIPLLSHY